MLSTLTWRDKMLAALMILFSVGIFTLWTMNLLNGAFADGLFTYQLEGNIPIFHLVAEGLMAIVTLIGAVGLLARRRWAVSVLIFGLGWFSYSAINSMGWAVANDITQGIPMAASLVVTLVGLPFLVRRTLS